MKSRYVLFGASVAALGMSIPAQAEWIEVRSTNFRYYSEDDPSDVVERVTNLEKLDKIVRTVTGNDKPPSPLPVTAFELSTIDDVQDSSFGVAFAAAYYTTSKQGAHLVTFHRPVKVRTSGSRTSRTYRIQDEVTQHEYLHHLMFQYFPTNYPTFYPEGFAEYYGTIQFKDDNVIVVGHAPLGRLDSMRGDWLHVRDVLTAKSYADVRNLSALYAEGWLLTHMAAARPERGKQLQQYLRDVSQGVPYEEAATKAFGDLDEFNDELRAYKDEVTALTIKLDGIDPGKVEVRKLSPIEEQLVEVELAMRSSIKRSELDDLAEKARSISSQDPSDAYGVGVVAMTEYLAGNLDAASTAAARASALDSDHVRGHMVTGMVATDRLMAAKSTDTAAWDAAREHFEAALAADNTATRNLVAYYDSYVKQGVLPPAKAQNALMRAFQLVPRNDDVRYKLAADFEQRGMIEEALFIISPAAFGTFDGDERKEKERAEAIREYAEEYTHSRCVKRLSKCNDVWKPNATGNGTRRASRSSAGKHLPTRTTTPDRAGERFSWVRGSGGRGGRLAIGSRPAGRSRTSSAS